MPRYIEKEPLCAWLENMGVSDFIIRKIESEANFPAADVVPKSEVENLIYKLECLLCHSTGGMLSKYSYDFQTMESAVTDYINKVYYEGYDEAKAEVAREIFEEIDRMCIDTFGNFNHRVFAELKKKYTKGDNDGRSQMD